MHIHLAILEDHQITLEYFELCYAEHEHIVLTGAFTAIASFTTFIAKKAHEIDILLIDIQLPDGDGLELAISLKEKYPHIKVCIFTADINPLKLLNAKKHNIEGYLNKNIGIMTLTDHLLKIHNGMSIHIATPIIVNDQLDVNNFLKKIHALNDEDFSLLKYISYGYTNKEIGEKMFKSGRTIERRVSSLIFYLDVRNRIELARLIAKYVQ